MLILQDISYTLPTGEVLLSHLNFSLEKHAKIALIGNNGSGKSTLLQLIAGNLSPASGQRHVQSQPYFVPQLLGQYNQMTIAQALGVEVKLQALHRILQGDVSEESFADLSEDWTIEERCQRAMQDWEIDALELSRRMDSLSGGQKTRVLLAGITLHQPEFILLDEPSNHLDARGRDLLYSFVKATTSTLLLVSHDRKLLDLLDSVCELSRQGIKIYGGNYTFYREQKLLEGNALSQDILWKEKELRKAKEKERESLQRQQKLDSRGRGKQEKAGVARIMINTLRNKAENSTAKLKSVHAEKIGGIAQELQGLRETLPALDKMKFDFMHSSLHRGKILVKASGLNIRFGDEMLWEESLSLQLLSGERIALKGDNGAGKTSLIKLFLGQLPVSTGELYRAEMHTVYIDQDYSLIQDTLSVWEQAQQFNRSGLLEHEVKIRLNRFLFGKESWDKPCRRLSGGEKMRLMLCCLTVGNVAPDMIILDEPTNNLDIQNVEILKSAINDYEGTVLVVSHDESFLEEINVERVLSLKRKEGK